MAFRKMSKDKLRWFFTFLLIAVLTVTCIGLVSNVLHTKNTKQLTALAWSAGDINSSGSNVASSTALYTKDYYKVEGLAIDLADDANISYSVYFYDANKVLCTTVNSIPGYQTGKLVDYNSTASTPAFSIPANAKFVRFAITVVVADGADPIEITALNRLGYINQIDITVGK